MSADLTSAFRGWVRMSGAGGALPAKAGRYHLYLAKACPWSSRALIARQVKRLDDAISVSFAHPLHDERGWAFPGGQFGDAVNGFGLLAEAYTATDPAFGGYPTTPVLWDKQDGRIVNNDSADIMRMLNSEFDDYADARVDLYPEPLRDDIDDLNERIRTTVNEGVYRAGLASSQEAYHEAFVDLFVTLGALDLRLAQQRYLTGERVTEADWRLFVTLVRFDAVYYPLFKCNLRRLVDYPSLYAYMRELYQRPQIAGTVDIAQIKAHYYGTFERLNPSRIVPEGPALDFDAPHRRV